MDKGGADAELDERLSALRAQYGEKVSVDELADIIDGILTTLHGNISQKDLHIYQEIESLVNFIRNAKDEIAALCPEEISAEHIPMATDELDAIVQATEEATGTILDAVEGIEAIASELGNAQGEKIAEGVTSIYEACNFQDITGQRISKVVNALRHIEEKVEALAGAFGEDVRAASDSNRQDKKKRKSAQEITDEDLLNGPQLSDDAASQDDIDALMGSFD